MLNLEELWAYLTSSDGSGKLEKIGDLLQYFVPWMALLAVALFGTQEGAWMWLYGSATVVGVTSVMKALFNKTALGVRPNGGEHSFPSGHTSGAFSGAAFVLWYFGWMWALIPLGLAILTGLSRVLAKKHWVRDTIVGALLALAVQYYFVVGL